MAAPSSFVVVANRLPVDAAKTPDGRLVWKRSPGGLVTALHQVMQAEGGTWIGWPGNTSSTAGGPERQRGEPEGSGGGPKGEGDGRSVVPDPFELDGMQLYPIPVNAEELRDYYEGFSNASLWPLYHDAVQTPVYHRHWWDAYVTVNQRFAEAAAKVSAERAVVWVQDYQLQLVPALLREMRPDLRIGFFLHIPFPPVELYMQLPRRVEILQGLLGADLVGFQRPLAGQNFMRLSRHLLGLRPRANEVVVGGRTVRAGAFPISINVVEMEQLASNDTVRSRAKQIRAELGDPECVILGVDRLDYTKGIEHRLMAFQELLAEGRLSVPDAVMVQVATPSRERVEHYQVLRENVERQVGRINGDYGKVGVPAVHYLHQSYSRSELAALYSAADVMMVTPLRDGMNLVAKEYVAARVDQRGTLVLSEFAGAAADLRQAFLVNPHDLDGLKESLLSATRADPADVTRRMRAMRRYLRTHDVQHWARSFLSALGAPEAASALTSDSAPTDQSTGQERLADE